MTLRFNFKPHQDNVLTLPHKIRVSWYHPYPKGLSAGEQWQLSVKLKPPFGMMNPGGFDYEGWLFQQGFGATGYIKKSDSNIKLADASQWHLNAFRQTVANNIKNQLPDSDNIGLIQGILVGIKHNITQEQWQSLRQSGTSHLLAISGLHIGLAAAIGFYLFSLIWSIRHKNLVWLAGWLPACQTSRCHWRHPLRTGLRGTCRIFNSNPTRPNHGDRVHDHTIATKNHSKQPTLSYCRTHHFND